ncbi:MAG: CrcB family protein [Clostridia bacterium]|nr:CrcB family protein [Clostridia bacterium]
MVAIGGASGAVLRYFMSMIPFKASFPAATLLINFCACFLMGFFAGFICNKCNGDERLTNLLQVGFCGGFSTLALIGPETLSMFGEGRIIVGSVYAVGTVIVAVAAAALGQFVANRLA